MQEKISNFCGFLVDFSIFCILLAVPVSFSIFYETWNIFELPKVLILRSLLAVGITAWMLKVFLDGGFKHRLSGKLLWILLALVVSWSLSTVFSIHPELSLWGRYQRLQGLSSLLSYVAFFLLLSVRIDGLKKIKLFLSAVMASAALVCLYGLMQIMYVDPMNWAEPFWLYQRAFSALGQPNFFGHFLIIIFPLSVYFFFFTPKNSAFKVFFGLLLAAELFCLYYTKSRSAWLGLVAEIWLAIVIWLAISRRKKLFWLSIFFSSLLFVAVFAISLTPKEFGGFWTTNRLASSLNFNSGSGKMRVYYWSGAIKEFVSAPWNRKVLGFGQEVLSDVTVKWHRPDWALYEKLNMWPDRVHNLLLDTILSVGLLGWLASLAVLAYLASNVFRFLRQRSFTQEYWLFFFACLSLFGYFVNNLFSFSMTAHYILFCFLAATVVRLASFSAQERSLKVSLSPVSGYLIVAAFAFFFGTLVFYRGFMSLRADNYFSAARDWEQRSNCQALEANRKAMMFNPDENVYKEEYVYNALNCFDRLKGDEEKADMRENISITLDSIPEREKGYYFHLEEANVASLLAFYIDQSYNAEAEARFTRLLADYPNLSQPIMYYAYHKMRQKEYGEILRLTASATEVLPPLTLPLDGWNYMHRETVAEEWARFYDLTALAAEMSGDYDTAIQNYKNELRANPYKLPVYKKIADIHYKKKDLDAALWYNERGYSLNRSDHSWPLAIGLLLEEKGDKEGAQAYFSEAERLRASTEKNDDQDFGGDLFTDDSRIK